MTTQFGINLILNNCEIASHLKHLARFCIFSLSEILINIKLLYCIVVFFFYISPKYSFPDVVKMPGKQYDQRIIHQKTSSQRTQSNLFKRIFTVKVFLINKKTNSYEPTMWSNNLQNSTALLEYMNDSFHDHVWQKMSTIFSSPYLRAAPLKKKRVGFMLTFTNPFCRMILPFGFIRINFLYKLMGNIQ